MRVSLEWLRTLVDVPEDASELASRLALTGTEVESVERVGAKLDGIYVGQIVAKEQHPDSDHLWVTRIDFGDGEAPTQIVCGAQNFEAGDKVPVAKVGTIMPDGTKIKKSKLRGVVSCGMNCSARELGIGEDHDGILILPKDAPLGTPIAEYLGLCDTVLDCEITPNRPDCLSMLGMAREVGAVYGRDVIPERYELKCSDEPAEGIVSVDIRDAELCPRYTARVIRGVKVGPSPEWLVKRITAAGARPINNVVDVTNYILFSLGQPLHAFDLSCFPVCPDGKRHVVVRRAANGEEFTTLDGMKRTLTSDMAVIAAESQDGSCEAVALAGVMGGLSSEVTDATVDVLLESATFSSAHTSRTSRNLSLVSEASIRYERGVDAETCDDFSAQAAALIAEVCGGTVCEGVVDSYLEKPVRNAIALRMPRLRELIGAQIPKDDIVRILTRLGCDVADGEGDDVLSVTPPTFRPDLPREIDLYEEVVRLWGMHKVPSTLPGGRERIGGRTREQALQDKICDTLKACGINETMTYSLVPADDLDKAMMPKEGRGQAVELINPMSAEQSVMRRSVIPGLMRSVAYNEAHGVSNVQLFEVGRVFSAAEGRKLPKETKLVSAVLSGSWREQGWNDPAFELDFFDAKGAIENLARELAIGDLRFKVAEPSNAPWLHPGRAAVVLEGGAVLGWVGEIHPKVLAAFEVKGKVAAFELYLDKLIDSSQAERRYEDVPRFPSVSVDVALVVDEQTSAQRVEQAITSAGGKLLAACRLFDVYRDEGKLGKGKKSLAYALTYRAQDRTLTSQEVEKAHAKLVDKVCRSTGAQVRG